MSDFDDLLLAFLELRRDHDAHVVATRNMLRVGPVTDRDHDKGVRVEHGTDEEPESSPWVQPSEPSGVARDLPRQGEHLMVLAPYGDPEQGMSLPFGHNEAHPNPSPDADTSTLFNRDGCTLSAKDGKLSIVAKEATITVGKSTLHLQEGSTSITVDGKTYQLDGDGHTLTGGVVKHEGRNIGSSHIHSGVQTGGGKTAGPDA